MYPWPSGRRSSCCRSRLTKMQSNLIFALASPPGDLPSSLLAGHRNVEPPWCRYTTNPLALRSGGFSFVGQVVDWSRGGEQEFLQREIRLFVHTRPPCAFFPERLTCRSARSDEGAIPRPMWFRPFFTPTSVLRTTVASLNRLLGRKDTQHTHPVFGFQPVSEGLE